MSYPDLAKTNFAAINKAQWNRTMNCGGCARVKCTDAQCVNPSKSSDLVYIVDQCRGCSDGDLDLSPTVFKAITGMTPSRVKIEWEFVTCPVFKHIEYCLKKGSNSYWAAVQPTNMAARVNSVTIDGKPTSMVESAYYFLLDGNSTAMSDLTHLTIRLTSVAGEVVEDVVSFANADCVEGSNQFSSTTSATSPPSPTTQTPTTATPTTQTPTTQTPTTQTPTTQSPTTSTPTAEVPTTETPATQKPITDTPTTQTPTTQTATTQTPATQTATTKSPTTQTPTTPTPTTDTQTTQTPSATPISTPASETTAPPTSSSDNTSSGNTPESINTQGGAGTGPTVVVSVLAVLGCLFVAVVFIVAVVITKKKKLDEQLEQEKLHADGSRYSSPSDFHTNVAIDEQMAYSYAAAVTPQPVSSTSI